MDFQGLQFWSCTVLYTVKILQGPLTRFVEINNIPPTENKYRKIVHVFDVTQSLIFFSTLSWKQQLQSIIWYFTLLYMRERRMPNTIGTPLLCIIIIIVTDTMCKTCVTYCSITTSLLQVYVSTSYIADIQYRSRL